MPAAPPVQVGYSVPVPPVGTVTYDVLVRLVNQQSTAFDDGAATSLTVPENVPMLPIVISVWRSEPDGMVWEVGFSEIVKSATFAVTATARMSLLLVPLIDTVNVPGVEDLKVAVVVALPPAVRVTLVALKVAETLFRKDEAEKVTGPAKPLRLVTVIVDVFVRPASKLTVVGLAESLKSVTVILTVRVAMSVFVKPVVEFVTVYVPKVVTQ